MTPRPLFFALLTLTALALAPLLAVHAHAEVSGVVPLEWNDTLKELPPGWKVSAQVHAFGLVIVPGVVPVPLAGFADALACAGGHCYGVTGTDGHPPVHVYIYIDGREVEVDKFWWGKREYDAWVDFTLYCPDATPEGAPARPPAGYSWLHVEIQYGGSTYEDWKLVPADKQVDLKYLYEATTGLHSWVDFTDGTQLYKCKQPPPPGEQPPGSIEGNGPGAGKHRDGALGPKDLERIALAGLGGVFAIAGLALLASGRRGG
ncbi:MAG: hypothetical protein GSR80_000041 [Desulfurococcales archaeon]|nr:hypothetical protein [Desulfurococcales archaeon]